MAETDTTQRRYKILITALAVLAALVTFAVYLPALRNGFVNWDDPAYVIDNRFIRLLDPAFFIWVFKAVIVSNWHPLTVVSHAVDYALFGLEPWGHHLTSIILHGFNTFIVAVLAITLARAAMVRRGEPDKDAKAAIAAGIVTALLFGLHPLHVESVAWVAERKDVLSGFFFLLSLLGYLGYNRNASGKRALYYALTLMAFIAALMSKPMAVTLPMVLLIIDFYPLGRLGPKGGIKRCLVEKVPFFALSLLSAGATLWAQKSGGALASVESHPPIVRLFVAIRAPVFYLYKMVWPVRLAPYYPHPVEINYLGLEYAGALIILICLSAFCILSLKRTRLFLAVWLYYLLTLLPVLGIIQVGAQAGADRYTYLPSLGLFILAAAGVALFFEKGYKVRTQVVAAALAVLGLCTLSYMTVRQSSVWKDSITLWSHEIRYYKGSPGADVSNVIAYYNRAKAYDELGELKRAIADYTMVVTLNPDYVGAYLNRGVAYGRGGDYERAAADFNSALKIDPLNADAYYNRGLAHKSLGRNAEAIEDLKGALRINPEYGPAYYTLSTIYSEIGEKGAAIAARRRAAELGLR